MLGQNSRVDDYCMSLSPSIPPSLPIYIYFFYLTSLSLFFLHSSLFSIPFLLLSLPPPLSPSSSPLYLPYMLTLNCYIHITVLSIPLTKDCTAILPSIKPHYFWNDKHSFPTQWVSSAWTKPAYRSYWVRVKKIAIQN